MGISLGFLACVTFAAPRPRTATALTSLVGFGLYTAGVIMASGGTSVTLVFGGCTAIMGLLVIRVRRVLFSAGVITTATVRNWSIGLARMSAIGIVAAAAGAGLAQDGHLLAAILMAAAGLSWLGVMLVLGFTTDRGDTAAGTMLMLCGACLIGLGMLAFHGQDFLACILATTTGVAIAGGGLSVLESTGIMPRLRNRLETLTKPTPPA